MISFPIVFGSIIGGLTLIAYYGSVLMTLAEGSFKKNIDPDAISTSIIGMLDGIMVQWILDKDKINVSKTIGSFVEMILKGIEK